MIFDASWLDETASLGNPITYSAVADLCDELLEELEFRSGLAGRVREVLLGNLGHDTSLASVSERLNIGLEYPGTPSWGVRIRAAHSPCESWACHIMVTPANANANTDNTASNRRTMAAR